MISRANIKHLVCFLAPPRVAHQVAQGVHSVLIDQPRARHAAHLGTRMKSSAERMLKILSVAAAVAGVEGKYVNLQPASVK